MQSYIPHHALIYLLVTLGLIIAPHFQRAPVLLPLIWLLSSFWQYKFFKQQWRLPDWRLKSFIIMVAVSSVWLQYKSFISLEFVTQLLLVTLLLKLLEMKTQRDVLILLYLCYFAVVMQLLFSQNILVGAYVLVALTAITACLISLYQTHVHEAGWQAARLSIKMTIVSVPILILAFIVFPRLDPFWAVPSISPAAKTGISDTMSPGSFSQLLESDALALRVIFEGELPEKSSLYWRTIVLDQFDGTTWRSSFESRNDGFKEVLSNPPIPSDASLDTLSYTIIQEPTQQTWLFSLDQLIYSDAGFYNRFSKVLQSPKPILERMQYSLASQLFDQSDIKLEEPLQNKLRRLNTVLPEGLNPKTASFARQLRQKYPLDHDLIQELLRQITQEDFFYTLKPPLTGRNSVDDFWFGTRRGLCEHYSQAMVVILRAANIPARVVTGFKGGFLNPFENYIMVHEKNAHAWVEAWVDNKGWQRIDPTSAISPQRIESQSNDLFSNDSSQSWGISHAGLSILSKLSLKWDQINFFWQQKILNFDEVGQLQLLEKLLGSSSYLRIALFILLVFFAVSLMFLGVPFIMQQLQTRGQISYEQKSYKQFIRRLKSLGITVDQHEACFDLSNRLRRIYQGQDNVSAFNIEAAESFLMLYGQLLYQYDHCSSDYKHSLRAEMKQYLQKI